MAKFYKLKFLIKKLKRLKDEKLESEQNIAYIKSLGGDSIESQKFKEIIIKNIEETEKTKQIIEETIDKNINSDIDREILKRRYKGETYESIAYNLDLSYNTVRKSIYKYKKRLEK